jgi:heme A synthase
MTRRITNKLNNGVDRDGFTLGFSLDWSHVFFGIIGLLFLALAFFVGLAYGLGVLCDS